jgi:hypothetical protein
LDLRISPCLADNGPVDAPAIKGSAFGAVVTDLNSAIEQGRISRDEVEARLEPADIPVLDSKAVVSSWYPIETYRRITEVLVDVEAGGRPEYLIERGARAAERLFAAGVYQQLRFGDERAQELQGGGKQWSQRDGDIMATLAGAIFNFSHWRFEVVDAARRIFLIEVTDASALPEVARLAAEGFIGYVSTRLSDAPARITSERPDPDRILFRLGG